MTTPYRAETGTLAALKAWAETRFGCRIYRNSLPHGLDVARDLERAFGSDAVRTVFDVGANAGQSALKYRKSFPKATIYSFEPVAATYRALVSATRHESCIIAVPRGMGRKPGSVQINVNEMSVISSIAHYRPGDISETIDIDTVSHFAGSNGIDKIDFLKIDTEGYELDVLEGARPLLQQRRIRCIQLECEPQTDSGYFVPYQSLVDYLAPFAFNLFGIYEQAPHWDGRHMLAFFNPVFVCQDFASDSAAT
jgi:FkbM family methyltransferase